MKIKINWDGSSIVVIGNQFLIVFLAIVNVIGRQPLRWIGIPGHWGVGFLNEGVYETFGSSRLARIFHSARHIRPGSIALFDGRFVRMFFVIGDPQCFNFARVHYPKRMSFLDRERRPYKYRMTTTVDQRDLVKCVRKFRTLDDELKVANTRIHKLREDKKFVESEMSDILRRTAFQGINKLEIQDDGSFIKVQRPDTWNKPWSLSQKELKDLIGSYSGPLDGLFKWIVDRKKTDMVAKEFAFRRIVNMDDNNDDARSEVGANRHA
jgi:hypothetical protein